MQLQNLRVHLDPLTFLPKIVADFGSEFNVEVRGELVIIPKQSAQVDVDPKFLSKK